jgi:hypothetical protein
MDDSPEPEEEWTERGRTAGAESPDPADSTGWGKTLELAHQAASTLVFTQDRLAELEAESANWKRGSHRRLRACRRA